MCFLCVCASIEAWSGQAEPPHASAPPRQTRRMVSEVKYPTPLGFQPVSIQEINEHWRDVKLEEVLDPDRTKRLKHEDMSLGSLGRCEERGVWETSNQLRGPCSTADGVGRRWGVLQNHTSSNPGVFFSCNTSVLYSKCFFPITTAGMAAGPKLTGVDSDDEGKGSKQDPPSPSTKGVFCN